MPAKKKTTTASTPTAKKAPAKKAAAKKAPARKTATRKTSARKKKSLSPEERYQRVQSEAYYIAEKNGFAGNDLMYWLEAEKKVAKELG